MGRPVEPVQEKALRRPSCTGTPGAISARPTIPRHLPIRPSSMSSSPGKTGRMRR